MNLIREAVDILLPFRCDVCGGLADADNDLTELDRIYRSIYGDSREFHICSRCLGSLIPQPPDRRWLLCLSDPVDGDPYADTGLYVPFAYGGVMEQMIHRIKFSGRRGIARLLGILMGSLIRSEGICADLAIPVPLSAARMVERGYNQAGEISYAAGAVSGIPFAGDVLVRVRETNRQARIRSVAERALNVSGAFSLNGTWDVSGQVILLTDDVATSGHTLREAAGVLLDNGARQVLCMAVASNRHANNAEPF